jgi:cell fate (sporulation/competence/biofilm development) regulator YlbF (YheA/YmcA/DUF963 family)
MVRHHNHGLEEEARILREEGEASRRRREAKAVRADWKAKSLAKKFQRSSKETMYLQDFVSTKPLR